MRRNEEAIQVTLFGNPSENAAHNLADRLLPWVPRLVPFILGGDMLPTTSYPHRTITFVRAAGVGKDLTSDEVARIHTLLPQLAQEFPARRQPFANSTVDFDKVKIQRLKRKTLFDRLVVNRAARDGLVRQNKTYDYIAKLPYTVETIRRGDFRPQKDGVLSEVAAETVKILRHEHIPATHHQIQQALDQRTKEVEKSLEPTWLEQKAGHIASQVVDAFKLRDHLVGYDVDILARNVALDSEASRAISSKDPNVRAGGLFLGGLSLAAMWLEDQKGWDWADDTVDKLINWYMRSKFPRKRIFGGPTEYSYANQAVTFGNVTPGIASPLALWALQVKGRESLRQLLAQGDEEAKKRIVRVAREGLLADYSRLNMHRRSTRKQSILERFPWG